MQPKFSLPLVLLSVLAATGFAIHWIHSETRVYRLSIATGSKEGEYYAFAQALSTVVSRHNPKIKITVEESAGAQQNLEWLEQGKTQLAIVQSDTPSQPSARAVAYLFPEVFHLVARTNAGIENIDDLRDKRIALMPKGSGSYDLFWVLSQHYDLQETDFTAMPMPPDQAYAQLRQGKVDALFRVMALGNPGMSQLLKQSQSKLVPIDQVESLRLSLPYLESSRIPKGTYDGGSPIPPEDLPVVGVRAVLIGRDTVKPEVIQEITRTLFEFRNEIVAIYPRAATMRLPDAGEDLGLPLHPGSKAFYNRDQPNFIVEYAESIGLAFSVGVLLVSGLWQLRLWLEGRQKNRADSYNLEILALLEQVLKTDDLQELEAIQHQLFEILRQVVVDLDTDRISPESFQSFTFPWEMAISALRHRETILMQQCQSSHVP
ncbi:MAG: TAXI family TRAP transporter solute-binding subunit [Cyanobacteria bacterium RM1_2_2]|nr:TAXI family TRAP transporter solute-binding subunit [Cyanobacteria bacterium RM1_2_2]